MATFSEVLSQYLNELSLETFPTGTKWRNTEKWKSDAYEFSDNADKLTLESLHDMTKDELISRKHFAWSDISNLQEECFFEEPSVNTTPNTIVKKIKLLRVVDKDLKEIDSAINKFKNLGELTLSANLIETIDSKLLPKSLKTLELCGNQIESVDSLCSEGLQCQLVHLGLSYNKISNLIPLTDIHTKWKSLVSLDLSFNQLTGLEEAVETLKPLHSLRSLLLIGNPLAFSPFYEGYTIDSLPEINFLDEVAISSDSRSLFQSSSSVGKSLEYALLTFGISDVIGTQKDAEAESFPRTVAKYRLEFSVLPDYEIVTDNLPRASTVNVEGDTNAKQCDNMIKTVECNEEEGLLLNKTLRFNDCTALRQYLNQPLTISLVKVSIVVSNERKPENIDATKLNPVPSTQNTTKESSTPNLRAKTSKRKGKSKQKFNKDATPKDEIYEWSRTEETISTCEIYLHNILHGKNVEEFCELQLPATVVTNISAANTGSEKSDLGVPQMTSSTSAENDVPKIARFNFTANLMKSRSTDDIEKMTTSKNIQAVTSNINVENH